jgi:molybdenum cofactor cytidylyltransferase
MRWGLRGDPHLWRDLRAFAHPSTEEQFTALITQTYEQLVGAPLSNQQPVFVARYSHGGMSSGHVSPPFWIETAIPLLQQRYRAVTQEEQAP